MRKRLLAIIATVAMVVAMMPSMVFGAEQAVTNQAELLTALNNTSVDTIKLSNDITLDTQINIERSVIIDGQGNTITGTAKKTFEVPPGTDGVKVEFNDVKITNTYNGAGARTIAVRGTNVELTIDGCILTCTSASNTQNLTFAGDPSSDTIKATVKNSTIQTAETAKGHGYGILSFRKVDLTLDNVKVINGYSALYIQTEGAEGSIVTVKNSELNSVNNSTTETNSFGTVVIQNVTNVVVDIINSTVEAVHTSDATDSKAKQSAFLIAANDEVLGVTPIVPENVKCNVSSGSSVVVTGTNAELAVVQEADDTNLTLAVGTKVNVPVDSKYLPANAAVEDGVVVDKTPVANDGAEGEKAPATNDGVGDESTVEPEEESEDAVDTGDNMNVVIPFAIAALALAAMGAVVATRRRHN